MSVSVPHYLHDQGLTQLIPPIVTRSGSLWAPLEPYKVILYLYVDGHDAYEVPLSDRQWVELGELFRHIHTFALPESFLKSLRREDWSPAIRDSLRAILQTMDSIPPQDGLQKDLLIFLKEKHGVILDVLDRTDSLAASLRDRPREFCLCHGDLHAGNLLLHAKGDHYLVDWDDLLLAPREKDLMAVGGGLFGGERTPAEEEILFYQGYGSVEIDRQAINYYRFARVIADLEVECRQILDVSGNLADRQQAFTWTKSNFLPGGALTLALRTARKTDH